MTLKDFRESYHAVTDKASSLCRTTNYSLIAIVWILCKEDISNIPTYRCVFIWLLLSLGFDYLQYFLMALIGTMKYQSDENKVRDKSKIDETETDGYPWYTPKLSFACFILKFVFALIAVCCLVCKLSNLA